MKTLLFAFILGTGAFTASAQNYAIDWFTIDGGGGTIGQPDAGGPMTGGNYSMTGGFWALPFAVQSADAPLLVIVPFGTGQARVSWTPHSSNHHETDPQRCNATPP